MATRFDPFRDLDRLAERMFTTAVDVGQAMRAMPIDLYRDGDHWILLCDLPGIDPGSIDVDVDGRVLTIRAQRAAGPEGVEWLAAERGWSTLKSSKRRLPNFRDMQLRRGMAGYMLSLVAAAFLLHQGD